MGKDGLIQPRPAMGPVFPDHAAGCFRAMWISDLHLGTGRCRARELLQFLDKYQPESLYRVGDIVDGWVQGPPWHWSREQGAVVQKIVQWHRSGVRIVFLPGNHDEISIDLAQALLGPLTVAAEIVHRTAQGRRMLVLHGHQFDGSLNHNRLMYRLGTQAYHQALRVDRWYSEHPPDERPGGQPWASSYFKKRLEKAIRYVTDFGDHVVAQTARRYRVDGVICGHTHLPQHRMIGPISYVNDGDWVRSCTALVEDYSGTLRLLYRDNNNGAWAELDRSGMEGST